MVEIRSKKGDTFSGTIGITFSLIVFVILVVIFMVVNGAVENKVEAAIEAENAAFTCNVNLMIIMKFDSEGIPLEELALISHAEGTYDRFEGEVRKYFDSVPGDGNWRIHIKALTAEEQINVELSKAKVPATTDKSIGKLKAEKYTACKTLIPLPCKNDEDQCTLGVYLEYAYD